MYFASQPASQTADGRTDGPRKSAEPHYKHCFRCQRKPKTVDLIEFTSAERAAHPEWISTIDAAADGSIPERLATAGHLPRGVV